MYNGGLVHHYMWLFYWLDYLLLEKELYKKFMKIILFTKLILFFLDKASEASHTKTLTKIYTKNSIKNNVRPMNILFFGKWRAKRAIQRPWQRIILKKTAIYPVLALANMGYTPLAGLE